MLSTFFCLHDISWKNGEIAFFYSLSFKNGVASLHSLEGFKGEERTEKCFPHMFYQWLLSPGIWLTHTQCVKAQGIMGLGFLYNTVDISVYIKKFLTSRSFWFPNGLVLKPLKGKWLSLKDGCVFVWSVDATGTEEEARRSSPPPGASLVVQMVKNLPTVRETWVQSLGREDSPREGNGYPLQYSAWRISWMEEPGGLQSTGSQRVGHDWATKQQAIFYLHLGLVLDMTEQLNDKWRQVIFYLHLGLADSQRERGTENGAGAWEKRWSVENWLTHGKAGLIQGLSGPITTPKWHDACGKGHDTFPYSEAESVHARTNCKLSTKGSKSWPGRACMSELGV